MDFTPIDSTKGDPPAELHDHFQGQARIQRFTNPFPDENPAVFAVHFDPGGRTKPHVHARGQLLVIVAGDGIIGTPTWRRHVKAGEIVSIMPGEWHWHGATPTSAMSHVTVQTTGPDSIDWNVDEGDWAQDY